MRAIAIPAPPAPMSDCPANLPCRPGCSQPGSAGSVARARASQTSRPDAVRPSRRLHPPPALHGQSATLRKATHGEFEFTTVEGPSFSCGRTSLAAAGGRARGSVLPCVCRNYFSDYFMFFPQLRVHWHRDRPIRARALIGASEIHLARGKRGYVTPSKV